MTKLNPKKMIGVAVSAHRATKPDLIKLYYKTERSRKKAWRTFYATIEEEYKKYEEIQEMYNDLKNKYENHKNEIPSFFIEDMKDLMKKHKETFECPICLEDMNHKNIKVLISCGHRFHKECIQKWSETSIGVAVYAQRAKKCPCCRKDFSLF